MNVKTENNSQKVLFWKISILCIIVAINITLISRLFIGDQSIFALQALKEKQNELSLELKNLDHENARLSKEIRLLKVDNEYIEKMIRQRLNYVREDETLYLFNETNASNELWKTENLDAKPN